MPTPYVDKVVSRLVSSNHPHRKYVLDALHWLHSAPMDQAVRAYHAMYQECQGDPWVLAQIARGDRFFLFTHILNRPDGIHPWLYERFREVERDPDEHLDLWSREHYKSSAITFAGTIQEIVNDPDITIGFFSHVRPIAKAFLLQIKTEAETNNKLPILFPDVFWQNPKSDAPKASAKWNEDRIDFIRSGNPKEGTIEAWGLVDGQPTSKHYKLRVYDDVVTRESVTTPEMVQKVTEAWELSDNLGAQGENGALPRRWHIGTRYSFADTYQYIIDNKILKTRIYPATDDGTLTGKPVFFSQEQWEKKKIDQRSTIAAQMLQNPAAGKEAMFDPSWLKYMDIRPTTLNVYIMCDPASSKKKGSDSTAMAVIGVDASLNKYLLDGFCHKMNLLERWNNLKNLRKHWTRQPGIQTVRVGYERFGMQSDGEYFAEKMIQERESFSIDELSWPNEGPGSKRDRIQRLQPDIQRGRFYLPLECQGVTSNQERMQRGGEAHRIMSPVKRRDHEGNLYELNECFRREYLTYPFSQHDDFLDACSRIYDMDYTPPVIINESDVYPEVFSD